MATDCQNERVINSSANIITTSIMTAVFKKSFVAKLFKSFVDEVVPPIATVASLRSVPAILALTTAFRFSISLVAATVVGSPFKYTVNVVIFLSSDKYVSKDDLNVDLWISSSGM